ncbi:MAG TPA: ATP-binding cassette domain-containing protein [Solirubrobacteraceae bacterium]|nr:ATP-binding cassette domain-containing protein [Solirubrobacteraceae bacterium]
MSLLVIQDVSKRYRRGRREYVALDGVSFSVESGEVVVVFGTRKSGRSTLLRIAAGLERPDDGEVRFQGAELLPSDEVIGRRLAYCRTAFSGLEGDVVLDHVAAGLLAQEMTAVQAARVADRALARAGASECARMRPYELEPAECVRVSIARALASSPALLVIDDPTASVGPLQSDPILRLLRSLADEGVAVLMSTSDATCLSGADRALSLDRGELRGEPDPHEAEVVPFRVVGSRSEAGAG